MTDPAGVIATRKRVIIDTDPGVDDALALALAIRSPELDVAAITTVSGNVHVDKCVTNVFRTLDAIGIVEPPIVARGCEGPLRRSLVTAEYVHGEDGLGDVEKSNWQALRAGSPSLSRRLHSVDAPDVMIDLVRKHPLDLTIITLGPLTNVAVAMERNPAAMQLVNEIVMMIGSVGMPGNISPVAEFNAFVDPDAAHRVFHFGVPLMMVGLDVAKKVILHRDVVLESVQSHNGLGRFVDAICKKHFDFFREWRRVDGCYLYDPLAVGVALDRSLVKSRSLEVDVETEGRVTRGMTVADLRDEASRTASNGNVAVCLEVDAARFLRLFAGRVLRDASADRGGERSLTRP